MGSADIIPGVSGGTIALITGIYERLVEALSSIEPLILFALLRGNLKTARSEASKIDYQFLVPLGVGILTIFLLGTRYVHYMLLSYPILTYSFFSGLIIASAAAIHRRISYPTYRSVLWLLGGGTLAWAVTGLTTLSLYHGPLMILGAGAVASCAMLLPGVSGAFVLLLLGQYEYILTAVKQLPASFATIAVFGCGVACGVLGFSRLIRIMLNRYRQRTLSLLVGLMLGALRRPVELMLSESGGLTSEPLLNLPFVAIGCGLLGIFVVWALNYKID